MNPPPDRTGRKIPRQLPPAAPFSDLVASNHSFTSLAAEYYYYVNVTGGENPTLVTSAEVTADYFKVFGVAPLLGRTWNADETKPSSPPVVVLGHAFWCPWFSPRSRCSLAGCRRAGRRTSTPPSPCARIRIPGA